MLAQLANFMDDLPSDKLHMPEWASASFTSTHCGTAGCAGGWAATLFHKHGLEISFMKGPWYKPVIIYDCFIDENVKDISDRTPDSLDKPLFSAEAFSVFFGIPYLLGIHITSNLGTSYNINFPSYCEEHNLSESTKITPRHVAKRIRDVLQIIDPDALEEQGKPPVPKQEMICAS